MDDNSLQRVTNRHMLQRDRKRAMGDFGRNNMCLYATFDGLKAVDNIEASGAIALSLNRFGSLNFE